MFPELKPYFTALVLPPTSLLILITISALVICRRPKLARNIIFLAASILWLLSTNVFSVWFHDQVIPVYPLVTGKDLNEKSVQAIVILGSGVVTGLPGGDQQMSQGSLERLRLGAQLARQSGLLLAFSGGSGWGTKDASVAETYVAEKVLSEAFGVSLKYKEANSRDTKENALNTWMILEKEEIRRIVLVTHSIHMPRASAEFREAGFEVIEAAVGHPTINLETLLSWMPSSTSLELSRAVLRELLARFIKKLALT
jgi:uncharacterized SAM-binding protein YcdF (DUF218 family)